jgi:Bifunctional DNA primase/polymerase, N-terminal
MALQSEKLTPTAIRLLLADGDFSPIPTYPNKHPACNEWEKKFKVGRAEIELWPKVYPDAKGTGILTAYVPTFDIDVLVPDAADAVENLVRERFDEQGPILVRFGRPPKRAIPFRCDQPFGHLEVNFIAPDGPAHKLEILGDRQQVIVAGLHGDTGKYYRWHGGAPGRVRREELPFLDADQARQLIDDAAELLVRDFNFKIGQGKANGADGQPADWETLVANIVSGADFHRSLTSLAASSIARGFGIKKTIEFLRGLMQCHPGPHDARWKDRYDEIARAVKSADKKFDPGQPAQIATQQQTKATPKKIDQVIETFDRWLILDDKTALYAMLGTVAGNLLDGDPIWLGIIAPPSSAKTELLNSLAGLPHVVVAEVLTPAALLSGTPKNQKARNATGGLLPQIGDFGILAFKDFGSVLDLRIEMRGEMLSALRRVYDGEYVRQVGSDGGRVLKWTGKAGLLFAATQKYDLYHAVVGTLGDRFLLVRLNSGGEDQVDQCFKHIGAATKTMRAELAEAVAGLFVGLPVPLVESAPLTPAEITRLKEIVMLAVKLRAGVERDRIKRDIEAVYDAEGPARLALSLERLFAGLLVIGLTRPQAMQVIEAVAKDSTPRFRLAAFDALTAKWQTTRKIATAIKLPTTTTQRALEDLVAQSLAERNDVSSGANEWRKA